MNVERIVDSYLEAVLFTESEAEEDGGEPLDKNFSIDDFHSDARAEAEADVKAFLKLAELILNNLDDQISDEQTGIDFWLTRNGHGAGFWDRDLGLAGDELTKICKTFGEKHAYVSDEGEVCFY